MERRALRWLMVALVVSACQGADETGSDSVPPPAPPEKAVAESSGIVLSPDIPHDVTATGSDLASLQAEFDVYSWNAFISLNWPPGPDGRGDPNQTIGAHGDNPTVWAGWAPITDFILPGGETPLPWGQHQPLPEKCRELGVDASRDILRQVGKTSDLLEASSQPFNTGPLVDQAGWYSRFAILVNQTMFEYIVENTLYSQAGQQAFTGPISFPCGNLDTEQVGAIVVKAAWKVLEDEAEKARFHTNEAYVYTPASENPQVEETCELQTMALVGLHIAHRTMSAAQWIWSTFEHVDNAPTEAQVKSQNLKDRYNYFNPACADCPVNTPPPRPWDPNAQTVPTQVVRMDHLPDFALQSAQEQNQTAQELLASVNAASVWQYYELISTQWPTDTRVGECEAKSSNPFGTPAPSFLANVTLETYIQGTVPQASSSCIDCHGNATDALGAASDFTYVLEKAQ